MWMVWTNDFGIEAVGDEEQCRKIYEEKKEEYSKLNLPWIDESDKGDQVILAKIEKAFGYYEKPDGLFELEEHDGSDLEEDSQ
ncbi:hypothetical protein [Enterococcus sp. 5H]|uniref:hypothetical protein n=1 Tax=Enterococcus sp. 5H TaxID=1229490 RepID=UPI002304190F|nr:hypothetical protein [Enterococcus sp. 5H]MDA9472070.1 hypothetical protein [Enterococcus sp. 5H]